MKGYLGQLEQMVLLAVLQCGGEAMAIRVREVLGEACGRRISRGSLYRVLDRLEEKGLLSWELEEASPSRGGHPRRRFQVSEAGIRSLRRSRAAIDRLRGGLEDLLEEP